MTAQLNQPVRSSVTSRFTKIVALFALIFVAHDSARAINMTVGAEQVIYTRATLKKKSLNTWPDGSFGVLSNGNGTYNFYGANGGVPTMTTGTLLDPGHSKKMLFVLEQAGVVVLVHDLYSSKLGDKGGRIRRLMFVLPEIVAWRLQRRRGANHVSR